MKKLLIILFCTFGLNFLLLVGGIGYLFKTGALNREKISAIKLVLYPATTQAAAVEAEKTTPDATTQPTLRLEELLAKVSGRPAGEQVEFLQRTFDAQMAQLDRREREIERNASEAKAALANAAAERDRLAEFQKKLDAREKTLTTQVQDKGFEDSLAVYNAMPPSQVKDVFGKLDDEMVTRYLKAMDASRAAKILKEFETPQEIERVERIMEMIRQPLADTKAGGK